MALTSFLFIHSWAWHSSSSVATALGSVFVASYTPFTPSGLCQVGVRADVDLEGRTVICFFWPPLCRRAMLFNWFDRGLSLKKILLWPCWQGCKPCVNSWPWLWGRSGILDQGCWEGQSLSIKSSQFLWLIFKQTQSILFFCLIKMSPLEPKSKEENNQ